MTHMEYYDILHISHHSGWICNWTHMLTKTTMYKIEHNNPFSNMISCKLYLMRALHAIHIIQCVSYDMHTAVLGFIILLTVLIGFKESLTHIFQGFFSQVMMTSSNGNIFHVTGPLCGEFTGDRWLPHTKASDVELWCFLWSVPEWTSGCANNRDASDLRCHRAHYDITVMYWGSHMIAPVSMKKPEEHG